MTTYDDLHSKLATVTEALARERSRYDLLRADYDNVLHDLRFALRENAQLRERLRGEDDRPMQRLEGDNHDETNPLSRMAPGRDTRGKASS